MKMPRVEIAMIAKDNELKAWYKQFGFVHKNTRQFDHLPFVVEFMYVELDEV